MKTLTVSTNNEKIWAMLLTFAHQHSLEFKTQEDTPKIKTQEQEQDNYVLFLCQNPLSLTDVEPMSREEIYA